MEVTDMNFKKFDSITEIEKGWSGDKKYCAVKGGTKYLLRISPRKKYKNRKKIHKIMKSYMPKIFLCANR